MSSMNPRMVMIRDKLKNGRKNIPLTKDATKEQL